jgi:hypothetical protein
MSVSALVVSYHTGPTLEACLSALADEPGISQIIIADHGNPPATAALIDQFVHGRSSRTLIRKGDNPGFGKGVNRAAAAASGTYLLIINPDCVLEGGALPALIRALQPARAPAIAGGRILNAQGQEARGARRSTLTLVRALGLQPWTFEKDPLPEAPIEVGAISGAFFLMKAEDFRQLGGFDEAYFLHVEDVDLCRRAQAAGGAVLFVPDARALHHGATSDVPSSTVEAHKAKSLARYLRKFARGPFERLVTELAIPFISIALRLRRRR